MKSSYVINIDVPRSIDWSPIYSELVMVSLDICEYLLKEHRDESELLRMCIGIYCGRNVS